MTLRTLFTVLSCLFFYSSASFSSSEAIETEVIKINYKDQETLESDLKEVLSPVILTSVFDEVGSGKVSVQFINDYNFENPNSGPVEARNDDIGYTHGVKFEIYKNLAPQGYDNYYLLISYESQLHTNSDRPIEFQNDFRDVLYTNEEGFSQADVYFKEQNTIDFTIGKIKNQNAYYWKAGIGYIEINTTDTDRGILLSSLSQQKKYHRVMNERFGQKVREYNYLENPSKNKKSLLLKTEVGRDFSLYHKDSNRTYFRPSSNVLVTNIKGASYVSIASELGYEYEANSLSFFPHLKLSVRYDYQRYADSSVYKGYTFEAMIKTKYFATKLQYITPETNSPEYLNPLPINFKNRELSYPAIEPTIVFSIEGIIPD